jgi:pimeloyl-ACP methyl ester carboxylesterase
MMTDAGHHNRTTDEGPRFVVFLGGLMSHSLDTPGDHALREDFAPLKARLAAADPSLNFVYFSYGAGGRIQDGADPSLAWQDGTFEGEREPQYRALDTTDRPVADHVDGLTWLLGGILGRYPSARIDLFGFSLGGIVALAWAAEAAYDDPLLAAIHRIVIVSSPVGGITSLGSLTPAPGVRHVLRRYEVGFGRSLAFRDLRASSPLLATLREAPAKVDVASVENSRDYLVNGHRITGQRLLPIWVRTIPLGRGAAVSGFLPEEQCYVDDLGGWEQHLRTTHNYILCGNTPAIERARQHIVDLISTDGPIWTARQAGRLPPRNGAEHSSHHSSGLIVNAITTVR